MKKLLFILSLILLVTTQSCENKDDCEDMYCFTPPNSFRFELVDKITGENLFTNGTFDKSDIEIIDINNQTNIEFNFIDENDLNLIQTNPIGSKTEIINYSIKISDETIFDLYVDAERLNENCCSFTRYNEIKILNSEFEFNQSNEVYKILID